MIMQQRAPQYIEKERKTVYWDWWRENPVEIILVVFIIALFALAPWEGCGLSEQPVDSANITVVH